MTSSRLEYHQTWGGGTRVVSHPSVTDVLRGRLESSVLRRRTRPPLGEASVQVSVDLPEHPQRPMFRFTTG